MSWHPIYDEYTRGTADILVKKDDYDNKIYGLACGRAKVERHGEMECWRIYWSIS